MNDAKPPNLFRALALCALLLCSFAAQARAQGVGARNEPLQEETPEAPAEQRRARRDDIARLLSRLNLSPEQRAQIRSIREQTEREGRPLVVRMRRARRALDAAIYSDAGEAVIEERLREFTAAQADVSRLRALTELKIRRVLTPEQLDILRTARREERLRRGRPARNLRRTQTPED